MLVKNWDELIAKAAKKCLEDKLSQAYVDRLKFEIEEICKQGANNYWLRLYNSKKRFNHNKHGLVLPYLLGMTSIDPIKEKIEHIIQFDPEFPDIDVDLLPVARDRIKKYAEETYGEEHVCNVGLWLTYKAKLALQDAATVLGHNRHEIISVCKELPEEFDTMPFEQAYEEFEQIRNLYEDKPEVVELAYKMLGKIKSQGKHAGGLIISDVPIRDYIPLTLCGKGDNKQWTSAWTEGMAASQLSKFGFVKFDLLGLLNISYIYNCKKLIKKNRNININFEDIDPEDNRAGWAYYPNGKSEKILLNDPKALEKANQVKMESIFQFDTEFAKSIVEKGGVKSFDDLLIYTSLGRPGPLPMIDVYIKNRDDASESWRNNLHSKMLDILNETKGVLTFQEQLLRIWVEVCGFTMPEAEAAQKAVKKKRIEILNEIEPRVIEGAAPILGRKAAEELWSQMVSFGRYCFNKCLSEDELLENPETNEIMTIEELYNSKKKFRLLSYDGEQTFVDDVIDVHYNGKQEIFNVKFSNGIEQNVTIKHRFLNEFGSMEELGSLLQSGHAIKYVRESVTNVQKNKFSDRRTSSKKLSEQDDLQADFEGRVFQTFDPNKPRDYSQNNQKTWSKKSILNQSNKHSQSQLLRENRFFGESLLAGNVNCRWIYSRGKKLCELAASSQRPNVSGLIWKRFKFSKKNIELSKRKIYSCSTKHQQSENCIGFEKIGNLSKEIMQRNFAGCAVYVTSVARVSRRGWLYYGQFQRVSDVQDWVEFFLLRETENHFSFRMWDSEIQNYSMSEQFLCNLLDWVIPDAKDSEISLSRCNKISLKEEANGRCNIVSIKSLGIKNTYSPEMRSEHHNYIANFTNPVIHKNSHAVAYMIIAYRCLWLKTHFPAEWWAAVLSECPTYRTVQYMGAARSEGIPFGAINVNYLTTTFSVDGDKVTPGILGIKGIGDSMAMELVQVSEEGRPFENLDDFVEKAGKKKIATERLIKLGGFDSITKNRKALWMWYVYKHDNTKEGNATRKRINACYFWPSEEIHKERQRQMQEYFRMYPKRKKIPRKIETWVPSTPRTGEPDVYDKNRLLTKEEEKQHRKMSLEFRHILKLFSKNYNLKEILQFEKEYLGYYWNSPVDVFQHGTKTSIEDAKITGILECVIEESFTRQGARGEYMILNVTDGINSARVNVWGNEVLANDEDVFEEGTGVRLRVNWQEKYRSFSVRRNSIIMPLSLKEEE